MSENEPWSDVGNGRLPMPDLDLASDDWSFEDRAQIVRWYELGHGTGDTRLAQFVPFLIDIAPAGFKRYRGLVPNLTGAVPRGIFFVHLYAVIGNGKGCMYEIIACRRNGFSKQQILDTLHYAFLAGGPNGLNEVAEYCQAYLASWEDDRQMGTVAFPEEWDIDPDAFRSGIDATTNGLSTAETEALAAWHKSISGEVPQYVELWTRLRGASYKANRARYEQATASRVLPKQMFPLMTMHLGAFEGQPEMVKQSLELARAFGGVRRGHIVEIVDTAFLQGGDSKMAVILTPEVSELIDSWPE